MKSKKYKYVDAKRIIGDTMLPLFGMMGLGFIVMLQLIDGVFLLLGMTPINQADVSLPGRVISMCILSAMFAAFAVIYISRPSIKVTEEGFQLQRTFYRSRRFKWAEINSVRMVKIARQETFLVQLDKLNWLYHFVGLNAGSGKRQFAIRSNIQDCEELLQVFRAKRPDLFKNQDV